MAVNPITHAHAVAVFPVTGPGPGFLQPIFSIPGGGNQAYLQLISKDGLIERFEPAEWPEHGTVAIADNVIAAVGEESLWAFSFSDDIHQSPLLSWNDFRENMAGAIRGRRLENLPLLQFDVVEMLGLGELMPDVYLQAFERYRRFGDGVAERWRERAIIEPALEAQLRRWGRPEKAVPGRRSFLRARLTDGTLDVEVNGRSQGLAAAIEQAFTELHDRMPKVVPKVRGINVRSRQEDTPALQGEMRLVVVGRLRNAAISPSHWAEQGIPLFDVNSLTPGREADEWGMTVIVGAQSDWREMVEAGRILEGRRVMLFSVSSSAGPLLRDVEFQNAATHPALSFFAPFSTSVRTSRDPLQPLTGILQIMRHRMLRGRGGWRPLSEHALLLREIGRAGQSPREIACRIGARALRAGVAPGSRARLYQRWPGSDGNPLLWQELLGPLFAVEVDDDHEAGFSRMGTVLLLADRRLRNPDGKITVQGMQGAKALFTMRGWRIIEDRDGFFNVGDDQRQFAVTLYDKDGGFDTVAGQSPAGGLGHASLVVVHPDPRREIILDANCGPYLHVGIEDIALMAPATTWIWNILRRQLVANGGRNSVASLKLSIVLAAEAVRLGRLECDPGGVNWNVLREFREDSASRHHGQSIMRFSEWRAPKGAILLESDYPALVDRYGILKFDLRIEDDGPVLRVETSDELYTV